MNGEIHTFNNILLTNWRFYIILGKMGNNVKECFMSVYRDLSKKWQHEWISSSKNLKLAKGERYSDVKAQFFNNKLEELEKTDPKNFSQYCYDFTSVQDSNRRKWGIVSAALIGIEVGLIVPAVLGAVATSPMWIGAVATTAVGYAVARFKHSRYKRAFSLVKLLRGDIPQIKYFKFFKQKDEKHTKEMERDQFLASEDYPNMLKEAKIVPVMEKRFKEFYCYNPVTALESTEQNEEYKPEFVKAEPLSEEEFEAETKKRARREALKTMLKRAVILGVREGIRKAAEPTK